MSEANSEIGMTTGRIEALVDGIFAIAMTFLIFNFDFMTFLNSPRIDIMKYILSQPRNLFNYMFSFILLAILWIGHHQQFHYIKRTDRQHLWINIFSLMFIVMVPFSSSLVGDFSDILVVQIFFDLNLMLIGLFYLWNWVHATKDHRLVDKELDQGHIRRIRRRNMILPAVAFTALLLALISPGWSPLVYLAIPFIFSLRGLR